MASNARNVARALPPLNQNPGVISPGGFGGVPATFGGVTTGGASPLVASYQQWTQGRPYGAGLPRDWKTFLSGSFGPLAPIQPIGIDTPDPNSGRPEPRRFTYPVAYNMPVGTPGSEGLKLAPFSTLRAIADVYSVARACINVRKQEILGLEWDIMPTREAEKAMGGAGTSPRKDFEKRRQEAKAFFNNPDPGKHNTFISWLSALLEDVFVIDALSIYMQPCKLKGKGLLGSNLGALPLIAGDTVRPLLDMQGGTPQPPNPAFQIFNFGVPRVDMTTVISGADLEGVDPKALEAEYRGDQLLYRPYDWRDWTPYGFSPIEKALIPILSGIQRQQYQLDYFSEGTIPGIFISSGDPQATPNQLRIQQDALNAMAGDPAWKHKIIMLAGGSKIDPMRPVPLADQFDEIVMTQVCMAFDVMPMELGISPKVSTTQSPGAANQMAKASASVNQRKALKPLLLWLKQSIFDLILQRVCGQADMQWTWEGLEEGEDRESLIDNLINQVSHGLMSIDEARVELGEQPWGLPLTSDPVWATPTGIVPVGAIDPATGRPLGDQLALPGQAGLAGPPGAPAAPPAGPPGAAKPPAKPGVPGKPAPAQASVPIAKPAPGSSSVPANASPSHGSAQASVASSAQATAKPATNSTNNAKPATKAALREVDLVRRRLLKGRSLADWEFEFVPPEAAVVLASGGEPEVIVEKARRIIKSLDRVAARDSVVIGASDRLSYHLQVLARRVQDGTISHAAFLDQATHIMQEGISHGLRAGARLAMAKTAARKDDSEDDYYDADQVLDGPYGDYLDNQASTQAQAQQTFLQGFLQDIISLIGISQAFGARSDLYAAQVRGAFEQGYGITTFAAKPNSYIVWHITSSEPCKLCADRDGKQFSEKTLPGWPGDGGFGGTSVTPGEVGICMGGPNCHCYLEAVEGGASYDTAINPLLAAGYGEQLRAQGLSVQQLQQDIADAREAFVNSLPYASQQRAIAVDEARALIHAEQGGLAGDVTAAQIGELLHGTPNPTEGQIRMQHPGMAAARMAAMGKGDKGEQATEVTHDNGLPDKTEHVYAYLARHYPKDALEWVKEAVWRGPSTVPLDDIQMAHRTGGPRNEGKVQAISHAIDDGMKLDPIVLVDQPGEGKYQIADGWHRTDAIAKTGGKSALAWVGTVKGDSGFSATAMGSAKLNKGAA